VSQSKSRIQVLLLFDGMAKFSLLQPDVARTWKNAVLCCQKVGSSNQILRMPYDIYMYMAWNEAVTPTIEIAYLVDCSITPVFCTGVLHQCSAPVFCTGVLHRCSAPVFCTGVLYWCSAWLLRTCGDQLSREALFSATGKSGALIWYSLFEWDGVVSISLCPYTVWTRGSCQAFLLPPWNWG